jgi:chemotaxis signal transduction protein
MIEILFFRIGNRVAGVETQILEEVVHSPGILPYLPISSYIKEMYVSKGRPIGIIDLGEFVSVNGNAINKDLLLLRENDISFGIKVNKIVQVRPVSESKFVPPDKSTFIPEELLGSFCKVKNMMIPIISPGKILRHPDIEPLWNNAGVETVSF